MTDRPETGRSDAPPAALPDREDELDAERVFPWGPWTTLALLLFIGIVALTVIMIASVAIVGLDYVQQCSDGTDVRGRSFIEFFLSKVTSLLLPLTILQAFTAIAMVVLLTVRGPDGPDGPTRRQMLALEAIPVSDCLKWTVATMVAVIAVSELPRLVFDLGHDDALKWLGQMKPVWLAMVLLVVLAPLSEELLFRGFVYAGLARSRIGPVGAILLTSGVWTVIHVQYDWPVLVQVFIFGIVFGVVRWRSGSLWPPIIAHGIVNLFAGLSIYGQDWALI